MRKVLGYMQKQAVFLVAVFFAAIVGGVSTAMVMAAIPDAGGQIHGCYRNNANFTEPKGSMRVINSETSENCTAQETSLNWDQSGGGDPVAYARVVFDPDTGAYSLDGSRTKNISAISPGNYPFCLVSDVEPKNVQITSVPAGTFDIKGANGWSSVEAANACDTVLGANVFIGTPSTDVFVLIH